MEIRIVPGHFLAVVTDELPNLLPGDPPHDHERIRKGPPGVESDSPASALLSRDADFIQSLEIAILSMK
ncbi:MAG: hypothetical protein ABSG38_02230 [Spirochaetia bacterium]